jgi:hypothetical protein
VNQQKKEVASILMELSPFPPAPARACFHFLPLTRRLFALSYNDSP